jgi:hypothetical protein
MNMYVPVHIKSPAGQLPPIDEVALRYLVARDGLYLERRTTLFHSSVRVEPPIPLPQHEEFCQLRCPKLPRMMLRQMLGFFDAAYRMHGGEAALVLLFHPERRCYRWCCPRQTIQMYKSMGKYRADDQVEFQSPLTLPEGYLHLGDAHSHHGAAVPSYIDRADENYQDGLHIIVGNIVSGRHTWHADFCIDGQRFTVPPELLIDELPRPPFLPPGQTWMQQIELKYRSSWGSSNGYGASNYGRPPKKLRGYWDEN